MKITSSLNNINCVYDILKNDKDITKDMKSISSIKNYLHKQRGKFLRIDDLRKWFNKK